MQAWDIKKVLPLKMNSGFAWSSVQSLSYISVEEATF